MASVVALPTERAPFAISTGHDMCRAILDDIISRVVSIADTATGATPCAVVPAPAAAEDVGSVCKSVLCALVSKVADHLGPKVAHEIKLENAVIDWLRKYANRALPSPSGEEASRTLCKAYGLLLNRPAFAKRLLVDRAARAGLLRLGFPFALRCIVVLLKHEPKFSETIVKTGKWKRILGMGASRDPGWRDDARLGMNVLASNHVSFRKDVLQWDGIVAFLARAFEDRWQFASGPFCELSDARKSQVWTSLLCKGVGDDAAARASARNGIVAMIDSVSADDQDKILASDEIVSCMARAFEDGWKEATSVFEMLDDAKKIQVYLVLKADSPQLLEGYRVCSMNPQAEGYNKTTVANAKSIDSAFKLYRTNVRVELENAFLNDPKNPDMDTLVKVATLLGLKGEPNDVLTALAPHMKVHIDYVREACERDKTEDKQVEHNRELRRKRLDKYWNMLARPLERIKKKFRIAMPPSMLPPPPTPTSAVAAAPAVPTAPLALPMASAAGPVASSQPLALMPPVGQPMPSAPSAPLALPQPSPTTSYLRRRVRPRLDCAKCEIARGPDPSVRANFAEEGGRGRARNVSAKRACPLAAHAINATDGVELLEQYERDHGVRLTNKKQKFMDFMSSEYNVERLGKRPSFAVSLYRARVNAALAVQGGEIKLNLKSSGYEVAEEARSKDNYMGFMII